MANTNTKVYSRLGPVSISLYFSLQTIKPMYKCFINNNSSDDCPRSLIIKLQVPIYYFRYIISRIKE